MVIVHKCQYQATGSETDLFTKPTLLFRRSLYYISLIGNRLLVLYFYNFREGLDWSKIRGGGGGIWNVSEMWKGLMVLQVRIVLEMYVQNNKNNPMIESWNYLNTRLVHTNLFFDWSHAQINGEIDTIKEYQCRVCLPTHGGTQELYMSSSKFNTLLSQILSLPFLMVNINQKYHIKQGILV